MSFNKNLVYLLVILFFLDFLHSNENPNIEIVSQTDSGLTFKIQFNDLTFSSFKIDDKNVVRPYLLETVFNQEKSFPDFAYHHIPEK